MEKEPILDIKSLNVRFVNEEGYILEPMYFLVAGNVVVSKNSDGTLRVEINAVNSYDVPVHLVYDASATGLENIQVSGIVEAQKMIVDGQLVIICNGKAYNALGAIVK